MNKKNKVLKLFSFVVVAFVLLLSVFTFIPQKDNNLNLVSAASDDVVGSFRFNGSNVLINTISQNTSNYDTGSSVFLDFNIYLYTGDPNGNYFNSVYFYLNATRFGREPLSNGSFEPNSSRLNRTIVSGNTITGAGIITSDDWVGNSYTDLTYNDTRHRIYSLWDDSVSNRATLFGVTLSNNSFNSNVTRVEMGLRQNALILPSVNFAFAYRFFYVRYYDVNDNFVDFEFYTQSNYEYQTRTYLFNASLTDNQIYNEGYNAGLSANQDTIYNQGFNAGKIDGYNQGFDAGVGSANDYTFQGLFGAVLDAPLTAFTSLLNFEIFGFNLLGFITGLLTLVIIIYIVKICVGGK